MPKLTNVRERVHQPFRDSLQRTGGWAADTVQDTTDLFLGTGRNDGLTNLKAGAGMLPSDQSHVTLALRCFIWARPPTQRGNLITLADGVTTVLGMSGDFDYPLAANAPAFANALNGQAIAQIQDQHRYYMQAAEQLFWSFGAGQKYSIELMPAWYFPAGGGLHGDLGGASDLQLWNNGMPSHEAILRLARAIVIPPRQNVKCRAQIVSLPNTVNDALFQTTQGTRSMLSLRDNMNAVDGMMKCVSFSFDGLWSREVQ